MKLTLAQLRALVAVAEDAAAMGVLIEQPPWLNSQALLVAALDRNVAAAERVIVWTDGETSTEVDSMGRPLAR